MRSFDLFGMCVLTRGEKAREWAISTRNIRLKLPLDFPMMIMTTLEF